METINVWQVFEQDFTEAASDLFVTEQEAIDERAELSSPFAVIAHYEIPIDHALKEQDKRTRHAIADAVAQHLLKLGMDVPGIDGVIINCRGGLTDGQDV